MQSNPAFVKDILGLGGVKIGPYVVLQVVTMGGVAVIYRGEHETLRNAVAVKVLTPEVVEPQLRPTLEQLFLREAQILSQLRSEDILRAHHHGRVVCPADGEERPYLVVDWLEGRTLSEELDIRRQHRMPYTLVEAVNLLEPIARALGCAHESGIVHRDVNPRNVFLEYQGPDRIPRAKLIDFGFAKQVAETQNLNLQRVAGTLLARSPDYSAPEHYDREEYGELSENTDIYTFALMLVEALTLESPLRGTTAEALRYSTANRKDRPTPRNRGAQVSDAVEQLFAEALAVDQFERPGVILDWWQRLKSAALGAAPATPQQVAPPAHAQQVARHAQQPVEHTVQLAPQHFVPPSADAPAHAYQHVEHSPSADEIVLPRTPRRGLLLVVLALCGLMFAGAIGAVLWWKLRPVTCPQGFADCNGSSADGCEVNLMTDRAHCSACNQACSSDNSPTTCVEGRCVVAQCEDNRSDCNQSAADGCEADLRADAANCGACGARCAHVNATRAVCARSKCEIDCRQGFGNCDGAAGNGCEVNLQSTTEHCGRCGMACKGTTCSEGFCVPKQLTAADARLLSVSGDELYFYDADTKTVERLTSDAQREVLARDVPELTDLAAGKELVVWATRAPAQIFARPKQGDATARRISGPLLGETSLSVTSDGFVTWVNRGPRAKAAPAKKSRSSKRQPQTRPPEYKVFTVALDSALDPGAVRVGECEHWPRTFAGDERAQYCCDTGALSRLQCEGSSCTSTAQAMPCPDSLRVEPGTLYSIDDQKLFALDRSTNKLEPLTKRRRRPRELTASSTHLYWLEGEPSQTELWRLPKSTPGAQPELLTRRQTGVTALAVAGERLYWVAARKGEKPAIYALDL